MHKDLQIKESIIFQLEHTYTYIHVYHHIHEEKKILKFTVKKKELLKLNQ